ncbi:hypothetical protein HAX54_039220 [Datura stramonium]|uniref:Uncharacterized protein n=1 Tax=Datura stramonium TaxID=4076 RepID=A0ABS8VL00_DATST|nr:hypothetical protein [Datura stramonium]
MQLANSELGIGGGHLRLKRRNTGQDSIDAKIALHWQVADLRSEMQDKGRSGFKALGHCPIPALRGLRLEKHWCTADSESLCQVVCPSRQLNCDSRVYTCVSQL